MSADTLSVQDMLTWLQQVTAGAQPALVADSRHVKPGDVFFAIPATPPMAVVSFPMRLSAAPVRSYTKPVVSNGTTRMPCRIWPCPD